MIDFSLALTHFKKTDATMAELVAEMLDKRPTIKPPTASAPHDYFRSICASIISQQLSVKAAATIKQRFETLVGEIEPERITQIDTEALRAVGLSGQKTRYILGIAHSIIDKQIMIDDLDALDDSDVIQRLVGFKGVGVWTAEMFLLFTLARPDIFSFGDLGLRTSLDQLYVLNDPTNIERQNIVAAWAPFRSTASIALWHRLDNKPNAS